MNEIQDNPLMTPGRYRIREGQIYDTFGRYFVDVRLWERWRAEGRSDRYDHDFELGARVEEDVPDQWHRVEAVCRRCGETRQVYWAVPIRGLNYGWCTKPALAATPRRWWQRLFAPRSI